MVVRHGDDDPADPPGERLGIVQVRESAECAQISLLHGVARIAVRAEPLPRDGMCHRLRPLHERAERREVAAAGRLDERGHGRRFLRFHGPLA